MYLSWQPGAMLHAAWDKVDSKDTCSEDDLNKSMQNIMFSVSPAEFSQAMNKVFLISGDQLHCVFTNASIQQS
jgi:hypothetical protein